MARGRYVTQRLSQSRPLWSLSRDHVLLWVSLIPWLDRDGRVQADANFILMNCVPLGGFSHGEVEQIVNDFAGLPDVQLYTVDGVRYMQLDHFRRHQNGYEPGDVNYERERALYPGPERADAPQAA